MILDVLLFFIMLADFYIMFVFCSFQLIGVGYSCYFCIIKS